MIRPTREDTFMAVALTIASRGTCDRKQVGAVIVRDSRPISWGYNGAPPGLPHCDANNHGWLPMDTLEGSVLIREERWMLADELGVDPLMDHELATLATKRWGCRNATHAEANALAFAAKQGISTEGATLYVTCAPCDVCARLIIAAGIVAVHAREAYRDPRGAELLERAGLEYTCYEAV